MRKREFGINLIIICTIILISCCNSRNDQIQDAFRGYRGRYLLFVNKKAFAMDVYNRDYTVKTSYRIAFGSNPDKKTKLYAGDNRTPEGSYKIVEILSMDADKGTGAYKKLKAMNSINFRARDGHSLYGKPKTDLGRNVYGPRFFLLNYPNIYDVERYKISVKKGLIPVKNGKPVTIGFGIAIHGNHDPVSIGHCASSGCIRMYNSDIIELGNYVQIGTPVVISSE